MLTVSPHRLSLALKDLTPLTAHSELKLQIVVISHSQKGLSMLTYEDTHTEKKLVYLK